MKDNRGHIDDLLRDTFNRMEGDSSMENWQKLEMELDKSDPVLKHVLQSFDELENQQPDIWSKLDNSLSLERTWKRLSVSLDRLTVNSGNKVVLSLAVSILFCWVPFLTTDYSLRIIDVNRSEVGQIEVNNRIVNSINQENTSLRSALDKQGNAGLPQFKNKNGEYHQENVISDLPHEEANFGLNEKEKEEDKRSLLVLNPTKNLTEKESQFDVDRVLDETKVNKLKHNRFALGVGGNIIFMEEFNPKYLDSHSPELGYQAFASYERIINKNGLEFKLTYNHYHQRNGFYDEGEFKTSSDVIVSSSLDLLYKRYLFGNRVAMKVGGGVNYNWVAYKTSENKIIDFLHFQPVYGSVLLGIDYNLKSLPVSITSDYAFMKDRDPSRNGISSIHAVKVGIKYFFQK